MANRNFRSQFHYSWSGKLVSLFPQISFGASGAPTLLAGTGLGVLSISRISAGKYTLVLANSYAHLLGAKACMEASSGLSAAPDLVIAADNSASASAPSLTLQFSLDGVAADPASGEKALMELKFSDSSSAF